MAMLADLGMIRLSYSPLYFPPSVGNCPGSSIDGAAAAAKLEPPPPYEPLSGPRSPLPLPRPRPPGL